MTASPDVAHLIWPHDIDDARRPSGGNRYGRRMAAALGDRGWTLHEHVVDGAWPDADPAGSARLADILDGVADGAPVLIDGLIGSAVATVLVPRTPRQRVAVLVHLPVGPSATERAALTAADRVVATSRWTSRWLRSTYGLEPDRVHVAPPGVEPAELASYDERGTRLLCVGAVTPIKGHDVIVEALARVADLPWTCRIVGSTVVDGRFAERVRLRTDEAGISQRITWDGAVPPTAMGEVYAGADLLVAPSRHETYGMALTEALAQGIPVIGSAVGGTPEALGSASDGLPGLLVEPQDPDALAAALRWWLTDPALRRRVRGAALARRAELPSWQHTADVVESVLRQLRAAEVGG